MNARAPALPAALEHVGGYLYATSSPRDGILSPLRLTADGRSGQPAGLFGLRIPSRVKRYDLYTRVVNLPWRPAYADLGWNRWSPPAQPYLGALLGLAVARASVKQTESVTRIDIRRFGCRLK